MANDSLMMEQRVLLFLSRLSKSQKLSQPQPVFTFAKFFFLFSAFFFRF